MKNFLLAFAVFLVWSFFGLWLYSWLQPDTSTAAIDSETDSVTLDSIEFPKEDLSIPILENDTLADVDSLVVLKEKIDEEIVEPAGLKATDPDGKVIFFFPTGITITKNSPEIIIPNEIIDFKYKLNTYLIEHPYQEIHISSLYSASENIESPNLGIKRARKIKEILVQTGISREKIVIKPRITEIDFDTNGTYNKSFSFLFKPLDIDRIESSKPEIPEPKTVYPIFSTQGIEVNEALANLLEEIKGIVSENPDITIQVIGHTDNVGNASDNYIEGLKYARQVRWYLVTKGQINRKKILAKSAGESESIASNKTERGRTANRRIEIIFHQVE